MLMERSKSPKPARVGKCGRARSGALPCAGLAAVTVSGAVSPRLSQLASASHPAARRWLICALSAERSLARRAFASGVAGHTAPLPCAG